MLLKSLLLIQQAFFVEKIGRRCLLKINIDG